MHSISIKDKLTTEIAVIGGGVVGMSIACGLQKLGHNVCVFDEGDRAFRAWRGCFGLIWVQGKGVNLPDYARWTRKSASLWKDFAAELKSESGIDIELKQPGGLVIHLNEQEAQEEINKLSKIRDQLSGDYPFEFLEHNQLHKMIPEIGPKVYGATYFPEDAHVNPLYLLRALYAVFIKKGGRIINGAAVNKIVINNNATQEFTIDTGQQTFHAQRVVLCAGLDNSRLAPMVGLQAPLKPVRGQLLITERVRSFLNYPTLPVRQVGEGALQIGNSMEDIGFNDLTTPAVLTAIAHRAVSFFPLLRDISVVRAWASLRMMSPDGYPIYDQSITCPGATLVSCHSGITLAAIHAQVLPAWICDQDQPKYVETLSARRFNIHQAA